MAKKSSFAVGAFVLVAGFVWIVFDNLALGLVFGFIAAGTAETAAARSSTPAED